MLKRIMAKIVLFSVLFFMVFTLIQSILIPPLPTFALKVHDKWGEAYKNGSLSICICDDALTQCFPCMEIEPIE